jgi:hypothetical protein
MSSWHCIRVWEPVRLILRRAEKVARCNWRSNLPEDLALIHGRGMKRQQVELVPRGEHKAPIRTGSRKTDTV